MLASLRKRIEREDEGFTLIELMVVVLIIAILLAIAIPTFLGARERAQDRAAQSDIRNALAAEKVFYTDEEVYTENATELDAIEPSLSWTTSTGSADVSVYIDVNAAGAVCIGKEAASGNSFSLLDTPTGASAGTLYFENVSCAGTGSADGW